MRIAITYLLASFQEDQERLTPHLQAHLERETDERIVGCLLLSLGQLLPATEDASALLLSYLSAVQLPLVRFCPATAPSFLLQEAVPEDVARVFFTILADLASVQPTYDDLP